MFCFAYVGVLGQLISTVTTVDYGQDDQGSSVLGQLISIVTTVDYGQYDQGSSVLGQLISTVHHCRLWAE